MIEIFKNLYVGNEHDYNSNVCHKPDWNVVHACKEPYHRSLLGYKGRGAPKDHPEYLIAKRGNRLYLNLVDADTPDYIPKEIIDAALNFIHESLSSNQVCLVHCNQGESRSPSIGILYLIWTGQISTTNFNTAESEFRKLYPAYNPKPGIRGFIQKNWDIYVNGL